jgi:hypothetical protein
MSVSEEMTFQADYAKVRKTRDPRRNFRGRSIIDFSVSGER